MGASESCAKAIIEQDEIRAIDQFHKLINANGPQILFNPSEKHNTTLFLAACKANMPTLCAKMICYPRDCNISFVDSDKYTAFMYACIHNMTNIANGMLTYANECNLNMENIHGYVALNYIDFTIMEKIVLKILNCGKLCGLNVKNENGETPFMVACKHKDPTIALRMLKFNKYCGLNLRNKHGLTPLMIACVHKREVVALGILENSHLCSLYAINPSGQTAFDIAIFNDMLAIATAITELYEKQEKRNLCEQYGKNKCFRRLFRDFYEIKQDKNGHYSDDEEDEEELKSVSEGEFLALVELIDPYLITRHDKNEKRKTLYPPSKNAKYYKDLKEVDKETYKRFMPPEQVEHYYLGDTKVCILD